ncbi:dihydrofolate reductase [Pontimicrobium aquaticum]|uniref:dihydrofolate reductase n=1 Tax=Pontimicrobium aquaticum TaxID=2565367 RepID=A0A4U0F2L2_9FLAO|nr:dihydrofolate reductase [Pontimicrobium aquaticum]TJY36932.1 dihydrofolate reductase [Pontimicrobium aquaticum]
MFGKKKNTPSIDSEQLELIQNAQRRIKQKKRLYVHFVIFLIGSIFLILANTVLGIGEDVKFFGKEWFLFAIFIWLFLFLYHVFNVFITNKFMGKDWEKSQLEKLVAKQQNRIEKLKKGFEKEEKLMAQSQVYNQAKPQTKVPLEKSGHKQDLTIIVAAAENDAIGKNNQLIWHLSDDLKRFKELTNGHHIIMGRKTFESFPKPLPNRKHVVISRQENYKVPEGVIVVNSLANAIDMAKNDSQPFIIGGGEIYKQAMLFANKIELTRVHHSFEADTFFPKIDTSTWKETQNRYHDKDNNHEYAFSFITYERK